MASRLNPYLNFNGNARQAMEFYARVFGGNLSLSTFAEFGAKDSPDADRIMHGMLETDAGYTIMGADITSDMEHHPMTGFSVSLSGDDADTLVAAHLGAHPRHSPSLPQQSPNPRYARHERKHWSRDTQPEST